jgi:tetratricopeptide (TPR) repeat protein
MKQAYFLLLIFLSVSQSILAQPTQAEIDKMTKQAQEMMKKYGQDSTVKKAMKDAQDKQKQLSGAAGNQSGNNTSGGMYASDPSSYGNVDNWKFPVRNTALLASIPKKIFSRPEMVGFLNTLYAQLAKKFPVGIGSSVQSIASKFNNDGNRMGDAAVSGWYADFREESLLLIVKAAAAAPDNGILLNNCAAILNMSGIEDKAIPILKYVLQSYPQNAMLLNNLGQAYAGLGETDTAMIYLGRSMKADPKNSEAANTAGQIEATKGNKQKAIEYFEKSIKSAYSKPAALKLHKLNKDAKLPPLVRQRVKLPEYFNLFKYDLPDQCTSVGKAAKARAEQDAFRNMITTQAQQYGAQLAVLAQKRAQENMQPRVLRKDEFMAQPFYEFCVTMARDVMDDYRDELKHLSRVVTKTYIAEMEALETEYQTKLRMAKDGFSKREEGCGDGKSNSNCPTGEEECNAFNKIADAYLPQFAALTVDWQKKYMLSYQKYFDELVYWHYLALHPTGDASFTMQYFIFIEEYLVMMGGICNTKIIDPCQAIPVTATRDSNAIKEMDCPLDIEIGFAVGKLQLNCEKFSFSGGEGAIFGYEKIFKTKQSTLSVGIGVKLDLGVKAGPVEAKVGAGVTETLFITFDGNNRLSDAGLRVDASASAGVEAGASQNIGKNVSVGASRELAKESTGVGVKFGINSGCNFNEGPFKGKL